MNRHKVIEILKEVATQAITSELNPNELDNEGFEIFFTRIDSLYSGGVSEDDIDKAYMKWYFGSDNYVIPNPNEPINNTFYAQLNTWRDCMKWFKSNPTPISEDEIEKYAWNQAQEYTDNEGEQIEIHDNIVEGAKWAISKTAQPEVAHCTQCGYHYDSLLKECPTCKGVQPMSKKFNKIVDIGDWVVRDDGKVIRITMDDMPELPYERIIRFANWDEIKELNNE